MNFKHIKLKDLLPIREAEEKDAEGGEENPFAAGGAGEEGGEEAAADAEKGDKEEEEEGGDKEAQAQEPKFPVKFNLNQVKKYNKQKFLSNQGELKSIDKKGIVVTVQPDNVDIFVSFDDII
jgi:hypothetical protein